jgi:membrane complex biogenesis BtpA family protein
VSDLVFPPKPNALAELFGTPKPIIGMIHLRPLPGAPRYRGEPIASVLDAALADARIWHAGGANGLMIENAFDVPFAKPDDIGHETAAAMAVIATGLVREVSLPLGVNCLANGVRTGLAVAKASGAQFVRSNQWVNAYVANEGFVEGAAPSAMRYRAWLRADSVRIFADVHVKHGSHAIIADRSLAEQTLDAVFFDADVLIATGQRTGGVADLEELGRIKSSSTLPVILGSGLRASNAREMLGIADGAIIGSWAKVDGVWWNPVDPERVGKLMDIVEHLREEAGTQTSSGSTNICPGGQGKLS